MSKKESCICKKASIGGQALIEGIMMRGPKKTALAVRNPQGEMVVETSDNKVSKRAKIFKLPIIRGVFNFVDSMAIGYKALMRSAEISGLEEIEDEMKREKAEKKAEKARKKGKTVEISEESGDEKKESNFFINFIMVISMVLGVVLGLALFMMLPSFVYKWTTQLLPFLKPESPALASFVKSLFEGVLKIIIIVAYMLLVSLMKDIRRTFQYHGAEHKTIFCYEHGKELTVENVRLERRFHPRCGTSFIILMLIVSIFISFLIDPIAILITGGVPPTLIRAVIKLLLLPLMMGVGYELIKVAGKYDNKLTRIISAPGMWLQHVTVLEPTDDMIECAIAAFIEVIPEEEKKETEETEKTEDKED